VAQTYIFDAFQYCGYLLLRSATRCGKTRLLRLISKLVFGTPPITTTPTPAVLFRSNRKVIFLDEVDKLRNADKEAYGEVLAVLKSFDDRFQGISEPLLVLALLADGERPGGPSICERLEQGLSAAAGRREPSARERQLQVVLEILNDKLGNDKSVFIPSEELLIECQKREELAWLETKRALANFLKHFDLLVGFNSTKKPSRLYRAAFMGRRMAWPLPEPNGGLVG
jgi:hypothetical protein